eukprot:Polyplicarium_translucidae@DN595_c0_g1_i4.p2
MPIIKGGQRCQSRECLHLSSGMRITLVRCCRDRPRPILFSRTTSQSSRKGGSSSCGHPAVDALGHGALWMLPSPSTLKLQSICLRYDVAATDSNNREHDL